MRFDRKYENSIKRGREIRFSERDVKNPSPPDHRTCGQVPPHVQSTTARAANLGTRARTFWSILLRIKDRKSVTVRVRKLNTERREARVPKGETLPKLGKHFHGAFFFIFFLFPLLHEWLVVFPRVSLRSVYEQGVSLVAKSFNKERMKENLEIFDWSLTEEESKIINELPERKGVQLASFVGNHDIVKELEAEIS
ncbi:unnamed protein product [Camellia sinensis]